ncbi:hypoxanthine phosphoribosyltransferase [Nodularia spumigena]|uniref:hypoxanthine phosphoribosyltransferase n=1 Tax=Nodularia spumigena TaxID=70799 RepID=UPI002B1EB77A|nr:hypoxanthine phosphoribosyltransferase [Nodularia spumigena]MEA5557611.1 hypoxanthine phosphoribosyltransferase [Nodularia spumigena CH309]
MIRDIERTLIGREAIARRVREMGLQIASDIERELLAEGSSVDESGRVSLISIMTGALIFTADLVREMPLKLSLDLVTVSSYPGASTMSKGAAMRSVLPKNLKGKHVLIVDDILDSGQTLDLVDRLVKEQGPASVRICVLLRKLVPRVVDVPAHYIGFDIPNEFVVGYGLDYDNYYRNHPEIGVLKPSAGAGA